MIHICPFVGRELFLSCDFLYFLSFQYPRFSPQKHVKLSRTVAQASAMPTAALHVLRLHPLLFLVWSDSKHRMNVSAVVYLSVYYVNGLFQVTISEGAPR